MGKSFPVLPDQRKGGALALFHILSNAFTRNPFNNLKELIMHSVIFRHDGIERTYKADTYVDALILFNVFTPKFAVVELWQGAKLIQSYTNK